MRFLSIALLCALSACATTPTPAPSAPPKTPPVRPGPFPQYELPAEPLDVVTKPVHKPVLIQNATVMTATGKTFAKGHVLLVDGKIASVGDGPPAKVPDGASIVDGAGMFVTPGLIDSHSHMGLYPLPSSDGNDDGNEATKPTRGDVWAEHGFWPQDPALPRAVAGGITSIQVLPGSANLIGGRSFTAKLKLGTTAREMRFDGAPQGIKMACGENPKRVHGGGRGTRMGNLAGFRKAFQDAADYRRRWARYERDLGLWREKVERVKKRDVEPPVDPKAPVDDERPPVDPPDPPGRDLELETLALVLDGKILVHNHCYRADEMAIMLDLARQFRFKIRSFHHALEAYKIRHRLAADEVSVSTWADWWGFKMETYDGIPQNAALLAEVGARAIIHSDSQSEIRHLNQEAAKAMAAGRQMGIAIDENEALRWITANAAWAIGVDAMTGTLTEGKAADVVVWDRNPFSVYARTKQVYIDGELVYARPDANAPATTRQTTDFELGTGVQP